MKRIVLVLAVLVLCVGCARRYRVSDPRTGKVYYTRDVDRRDSGAVEFNDAQSNAKITLESSVVERIPKDEYERLVARD